MHTGWFKRVWSFDSKHLSKDYLNAGPMLWYGTPAIHSIYCAFSPLLITGGHTLNAPQVIIQGPVEVADSGLAGDLDLIASVDQEATASEEVEGIAQVAAQAGSEEFRRRRATSQEIAQLSAVDLEGGETLLSGVGGDGVRGDGDISAPATGVEVNAETDGAGSLALLDVVGRRRHDKGGDGVVGGGGDGARGRDGADTKGEEGGEEDGDGMHFGYLFLDWC
ncbi:hypothetical protein B0T14DRAFT_512430 [Immersiella caudata]|uniref:Uncharacterized protein n=1 Tax=Immersiella caudata TaxID=314043 RepID=A0AA39X5T4_9PEZI|nr:hypothetical protein B0T14DRAFT_512430 [Immersiella caudata]